MNDKTLTPEENFLKQLFVDVNPTEMRTLYTENNINKVKFDLFREFIFSLITKVHETYLGYDVIFNEVDIENHFSWCFKQTCEKYSHKGDFTTNKELYFYFLEFFNIGIYSGDESLDNDNEHFTSFFTFDTVKKQYEMRELIELYNIFDKTPVKGRFIEKKVK